MDHYTAYVLANSPLITEDRLRCARRHQAIELRRGVGEAGLKITEIVRRCVRFNG